MELTLGGARLRLLPQRAVFWPEQRMLLVADAHIGKAVSFRRLGDRYAAVGDGLRWPPSSRFRFHCGH